MLPGFFKMIVAAVLVYSIANGASAQQYMASPETGELAEARIFPFNYNRIDARYDLFLDLADSTVKNKYTPVFLQYKLSFSGEAWELLLRQMLERTDRDMARHVQLMPEEEGVYISTGNKITQQKFLREILPVLSNIMLLEKHLQRLDRSRLAE